MKIMILGMRVDEWCGAQIAELNAALEELEEEKGRDLLALQTQHQERQRALCVRLHDFYLRKVSSQPQQLLAPNSRRLESLELLLHFSYTSTSAR
jgi:hypothetical protein